MHLSGTWSKSWAVVSWGLWHGQGHRTSPSPLRILNGRKMEQNTLSNKAPTIINRRSRIRKLVLEGHAHDLEFLDSSRYCLQNPCFYLVQSHQLPICTYLEWMGQNWIKLYSFADAGRILVVAAAVRDRQAVRHFLTKMLDMHYYVPKWTVE